MNESLLVIDKAAGPSSFDVVRAVKNQYRGLKVGHTGSLDPFATGVLVLLLGRATKMSQLLLNADKSYHATVKLGESTDTADRTGEVTKTAPVPELTASDIEKLLKNFEGEWLQTPPMYSAKKLHGVRLYELARQNIHVPRAPIPVQLYKMEFVKYEAPFLEFQVECSKGTYIRSLAEEIGKRLGTVAHLAELRRTSCGEFKLEDSMTLEKLAEDLEGNLRRGYQQYVRLVRAESLGRRQAPAFTAHPSI